MLETALIIVGAFISLSNWRAFYVSSRRERHVSAVPFLGGILLFLGLSGFPRTSSYAWLGLVADYGTIAGIAGLPAVLAEAWRTSRFNLLHRFVSEGDDRTVDLRLFAGGRFTVRIDYDPPVADGPEGALLSSTGMTGTWREEGPGFVLEGDREGRTLRLADEGARVVASAEVPTEEGSGPPPGEGARTPDRLDGLTLQRVAGSG